MWNKRDKEMEIPVSSIDVAIGVTEAPCTREIVIKCG
jgi:hypothetical protein